MSPVVSVILPVYNSEKYIREAIQCVLNQTFRDFELLVFDDASTDGTLSVLKSIEDERFRLIIKGKNTGYTQSLVAGVEMAQGKYIARMDSDDQLDSDRFRLQVEWLENHPDIGIVGTYAQTIVETGNAQIWEYPLSDEDIRCHLLADSPFAHPAVMIRKSVLQEFSLNYDAHYEPCEDFKLWFELMKKTKGANLPLPLLKYRLHAEQTIQTRRNKLLEQSSRIRKEIFLHEFGVELNETELELHYAFFNEIRSSTLNRLEGLAAWRRRLLQYVHPTQRRESYERLVGRFWLRHLYTLTEYRPRTIIYLFDSYVFRHMPKRLMMLFVVKSLCFYRIRS